VKITFQGEFYEDILTQMANVLAHTARQGNASMMGKSTTNSKSIDPTQPAVAQGPGPDVPAKTKAVPETPVETPVAKSGKTRTPKQLENDAKLRERALAKKAAGLKPFEKTPKAAPVEKPAPPPPATAESLGLEPDEVVKLRLKTIADLQDAYANGHQKEVFELLSRFGNGAKSFRELPADAFVPISEAIANGALT
jgi:hypothetical protein